MSYKLFVRDDIGSITSEQLEQAIASLPEWRREKALRFKFEQGRKECAVAYLLLCKALKEGFGIDEQPHFSIGEHGKPSLVEHPEIHFNVSHCKKAVACVVSSEAVGVDVECIGRYNEALARHVLNDKEYAQVCQSSNPQLLFTSYWTQKEAIVKLTGRGIDDDLKNLLLNYPQVSLHTETHPEKGYVLTVATWKTP
ncbi:MAG: 4'-phosphopantetheinyl transferase superfamily protein [Bacteroidaceae bacterium]|nr:4'-phosphopantetheinyl transferase superfamily protein [Bacteroidaceae bacterium]